MDKSVTFPFENKDGTKLNDPITLNMLSFNMGGLNKVLTNLPDAPSGGFAKYESSIEVDDFGTGIKISSPKDINQICLSLEHSSLSDLEMVLQCPTGQQIVLFNSYAGKEGKDLVPGGFMGKDVGLGNDLDEPGFTGSPVWQYCFSTKKANFGTMADEYMLQNFKLNIVNNLSMNPNITTEIIEKYPDKPWNWDYISLNSNITIEFIEKYPDKKWYWKSISKNPNITMEIIEKYPDKPWDWDGISMNKFSFQNKINEINYLNKNTNLNEYLVDGIVNY
jgi:hypothetical protein